MRISIGCVDGIFYTSDYISDEKANEEISNGLNFTGAWKNGSPVDINNVHDYGNLMIDVALGKSLNGYNPTEISFKVDGIERHFNPKHIVWIEVVYDDDEPKS